MILKANEKTSNENFNKIDQAIKSTVGEGYQVAYGYVEKNYLIITMISHYAIGFKDEEICVAEISKSGEVSGQVYKFTEADEKKVNLYGKVVLANENKKLKITVPGVVPSIAGTKQMPINQVEATGALIAMIKGE